MLITAKAFPEGASDDASSSGSSSSSAGGVGAATSSKAFESSGSAETADYRSPSE